MDVKEKEFAWGTEIDGNVLFVVVLSLLSIGLSKGRTTKNVHVCVLLFSLLSMYRVSNPLKGLRNPPSLFRLALLNAC